MEAAAESRCPNCFSAPLNTPCRRCGWASGLDNPPPALALGTMLDGRYRIGRVLGHGGFGITYLAWDENLHLRLAIKEYLPRDSATRAPDGVSLAVYSGPAAEQFAYGLERFLEEARALARFDQHPGIVTVKSFFRAHGTGYSVMEFVDGLTLKQYLAQQPEGRLAFEQALKLLMPVMDALRAVHKDGLLHRDITPDNIYLSQDGRVKLLDFGAARFAAGEHSRSLSVILKPGYAPEEQYRTRGQQGPWTDVYSLAATLYRAITGQVPPEALDRLDADELVPPSQLGAVITPEQEAVLVRALAVRAAGRFESIEALQQAWKETASSKIKSVSSFSNATAKSQAVQVASSSFSGSLPLNSNNKLRYPDGKNSERTSRNQNLYWFFSFISLMALFVGLAFILSNPSNQKLAEFQHKGAVIAVAFSSDGEQLLTGSSDKTAALWEVGSNRKIAEFLHGDHVRAAIFSPDGKKVLTRSWENNTAMLWDVDSGKKIAEFWHQGTAIWTFAFSPDGQQVLTGSMDKTAVLWDVASGKKLAEFLHKGSVRSVVFSPSGKQVLTGSDDTTAVLWNIASGKKLAEFKHKRPVVAVMFSPDGHQVLTGSWDNTAGLWDVANGKKIAEFNHGGLGEIKAIDFSFDGRMVLTGSSGKSAALWDVKSGKKIASFNHKNPVVDVVFSPDGKQVLTASLDNTAVLWKVANGKKLAEFQHKQPVVDVEFSPDGRYALTGSWDNTAVLWALPDGK